MELTNSRQRVIHSMVTLALEEEARGNNYNMDNIIKNTKLYAKKTVKNLTTEEIVEVLNNPLINIFFKM